jgi:hypothetical protein
MSKKDKIKKTKEAIIEKPLKKITENTALSHSIDNLSHILRQRTSWRWRFRIGIATGIGTVIGATVLAGVVIYILSLIVAGLDLNNIPVLQNIIEQANLNPTTPTP